MSDWTLDDLYVLADAIGQRIEAGKLPPQDDQGRYVLGPAELNVG